MTTYNVSIPDNKNDFFLQFLELIGAEYEENSNVDFQLSDEQKNILDKALKQDKKTFISRDDITRKYKL